MMIDRRVFMTSGIATGMAAGLAPRIAYAAAETPKRLLFVLQRGAADGLDILAPIGDPAYADLRGSLLERAPSQHVAIDPFFALHPAMPSVAALYGQREVAFVHATATDYRDRSHFDAQNMMETGGQKPYRVGDGWLNRLVGLLPEGQARALALASSIPLALQGNHSASSFAPSGLRDAGSDMNDRVADMYAADPMMAALWAQAMETRAMAGDIQMRNSRDARMTGELAASLMAEPDGARIMMVESNGWDSHQGQPAQLNGALRNLDGFIDAFQGGMGNVWGDTLVIIATEFGRTARVNGTNGTDHGTGSVAMLLGGAVNGGRVMADWPGLGPADLYEGRDLKPTVALEAVLAGSVADHFGLDPARAMHALFPGRSVGAIGGFITA